MEVGHNHIRGTEIVLRGRTAISACKDVAACGGSGLDKGNVDKDLILQRGKMSRQIQEVSKLQTS